MSVSYPTVNPQNSNRVSAVVNKTNFPGLLLDINAKNITNLPIGLTDASNKAVQSFTDGVGNIVSVSETNDSWFTGVETDAGLALFLRTQTGSSSVATGLQLTNKPTLLITTGRVNSNSAIVGIGSTDGFFQGIGQSANNNAYATRGGIDYKETFNFQTSVLPTKVTQPVGAGMVTHIADNASGDWRECFADYKGGAAEYELASHTGVGASGAHASNDWSTSAMSLIRLIENTDATQTISYIYTMRLLELDTALTDIELTQLALFIARNPYDLPEFLVDH